MSKAIDAFHQTVAEALDKLPARRGKPYADVMRHGTMHVEIFAPQGIDTQTPHAQDELYFVISGTGEFVRSGQRRPFGPGDAIFVPAGEEHRFENFSDDLTVWVVFYGPRGGEQTA